MCISSQDVDALVDAVLELATKTNAELERMGNAGLDFYKTNLSMKNGVDRFLKVFQSVLLVKSKEAI